MAKPRSNVMSWIQTLWTRDSRSGGRSRARRVQRPMQAEMLEVRELLSAILLDIPGINGDAVGNGATTTDIELTSFNWGFSRDTGGGAATSPTAPIEFTDLTFEKKLDSATNDLYAQSNFSPVNGKATKLRFVDTVLTPGKTLLNFDLTNARVTSFSTKNDSIDGGEAGSLAFSKLAFTESSTATNRTASWNLLDGAVSKSAIASPGVIDKVDGNGNVTEFNIATVLEIDGQKLIIDDFEWGATNDGTNASGKRFRITRDVDSGTAGLLGSAAAGTTFSNKVTTITDRRAITANGNTSNKVVMEWNLYNASISDFGLSAETTGEPTNTLGLSYSKIELKVTDFNAKFPNGQTLTTVWDEANKVITPAANFGTEDPSILANDVSSYLDFGTLGKVRYEALDWSLAKPTTITTKTTTTGKTTFGPMSVELKAGASTPALLGVLASKGKLTSVEAKEQDKLNLTSALNTWTLSNTGIADFSISSKGLEEPTVTFGLDFDSAAEVYNDRKIPLITRGNFNQVTQTSTGALIFGVEVPTANPNFEFEFELEITQTVNGNSVKTEIPVTKAEWEANRAIVLRPDSGTFLPGELSAGTFDLSIPRGVHSPGLFAAAARGTKIEKAIVRRYDTVGKDQIELYRWELTDAFLTGYVSHMLPGNDAEEVDRISFNPSKITLVNPNPDKFGSTNYDFTKAVGTGGGAITNPLDPTSTVLQTKIEALGNDFFAIDSFSWGAKLPVDATSTSGERPLGNPDASDLSLNVTGLAVIKLKCTDST